MALDYCGIGYGVQLRSQLRPENTVGSRVSAAADERSTLPASQQWLIKPYLEPETTEFHPSTWVQLRDLPSPFSGDQALLLCQQDEEYWLAWVPDHGEVLLHISQFESP